MAANDDDDFLLHKVLAWCELVQKADKPRSWSRKRKLPNKIQRERFVGKLPGECTPAELAAIAAMSPRDQAKALQEAHESAAAYFAAADAAEKPKLTKTDEAKQFLLDILRNGRILRNTVVEKAAAAGITESILRVAKRLQKVESEFERDSRGRRWYWFLPQKTQRR